ncbi:Tc toxin subunit A-related protein [Streptomyces sp. NPDC055013]
MSPDTAVLLYSAHPVRAASAGEEAMASRSPRTAVLDEIKAELDKAHGLVLAGDYLGATQAYQSLRNRIFRLLADGGSARAAAVDPHFGAPHDVAHLKDVVRAGAVLLGDLVPRTPDTPVIDASIDRTRLGGYGEAAKALPRPGTGRAVPFAEQARLGMVAFDNGEYDVAVKQLTTAADQAKDDKVARAGLLLNAGAAAAQAGRSDQAVTLLNSAADGFREAENALGTAQAMHNLAVVTAATGEVARTEEVLKQTDEQSGKAAGSVGSALGVMRSLGRLGTGTPTHDTDIGDTADLVVTGARVGNGVGGLLTGGRDGGLRVVSADVQAALGRGIRLVVRDPLIATAWRSDPLADGLERDDREVRYTAGFVLGSEIRTVNWRKAAAPSVAGLVSAAYESRTKAKTHLELRWSVLSAVDVSVQLAHLFFYVIPVGLGEAYTGLGDWANARLWLYRAAEYPYLNPALEAPVLWLRLAQTYLGEGDTLYRRDDLAGALAAYGRVVAADGTRGDGSLYTLPALAAVGTLVDGLLTDPETLPGDLDAGLGAVVLDIAAKVAQLGESLDWFGVPADFVPPFTFDYLQSAARFLAQQAQASERDFIQFMDRYESGKLTRLQLQQAVSAASADVAVAEQQAVAARDEIDLAQTAQQLAGLRRSDAQAARQAYASMSGEQIGLERQIAWYSSQNSWELSHPIPGDGRRIHEVIAANRHRLGVISRDYELLRMQQNINELALATQQASDQVALSQARARAADLSAQAARLRRQQAQQLLSGFEQGFFTPEVWRRLADFMHQQALRYLYWATRVARLAERAYEFDYDTAVDRIRADYAASAVNGMLGSDQLLADLDYFTYDRITRTGHKTLRAGWVVSLAEKFPFAFAGFRRTGRISFDTLLFDLEREYPGSYNHRVQAVEVAVVGLVPDGGLRGTLVNSGVSQYRALDGTVKWRLQNVDTMLLSSYGRDDSVLFRPRPELLNVFEGVGMASGWTLRYPPDVNDVDYRFIVDVQVTFHFEAQFDRALAAQITAAPLPPEALRANTSFSLGNDFPDRFFLWRSQSAATLPIGPEYLPHHHVDPVVRTVSLQLLGRDGSTPPIPLTLTAPGGANADVIPDANGRVPSTTSALAALHGADVLGEWGLATAADPADSSAVYDVLLFVEYSYTRRGEA